MEWQIIGPKLRGKRSFEKDTKGQDIVVQYVSDDFACIVVTDGVGSALYALEGAQKSAYKALNHMKDLGSEIFEFSDERLRQSLLGLLIDELKECAEKEGSSIKEFASTLMFFVTDGRQYISGNLGDGLVGSIDKKSNSEVIHAPEKGKYANQSYFITSSESHEHLRISRGQYDKDKIYFLMTDGTVDCLYNYITKEYAKALHTFCKWVRNYDRAIAFWAIVKSMQAYFPQRTDDDCVLVLIHGKDKWNNID